MKRHHILLLSLAALATATPTPLSTTEAIPCGPIPGSSCTPGTVTEPNGNVYNETCGVQVHYPYAHLPITHYRGVTFQDCVQTCALSEFCCAVNYVVCGGHCRINSRKDFFALCDQLAYEYTPAPGLYSARIISGIHA